MILLVYILSKRGEREKVKKELLQVGLPAKVLLCGVCSAHVPSDLDVQFTGQQIITQTDHHRKQQPAPR